MVNKYSHIKIVNASQGHIHKYEDAKRKLYSCIASTYFNRQCLRRKLVPNCAKIKIPTSSPAAKFTQHRLSGLETN
jgi:hypothetical protein